MRSGSYSRAVTVETRGTSLGVVTFGLGFATNLDGEDYCSGCGRGGHYLPFGASVTEDGLYLVPFQPSNAKDPPFIVIRTRPVGIGDVGELIFGSLQCYVRAKPVGTRIDGGNVVRVLYSDGAVWTRHVRRLSRDCVRDWPIKFGGVAIAAATSHQGWVVATGDSAGSTHIRGFGDLSRPLWSISLRSALGATNEVRKVALAPVSGGVTVSLTEGPFSWALVDSAGSVRFQSSPFTGQLADPLLDRVELEKWKGFSVLPVRNGFIQTLESPACSKACLFSTTSPAGPSKS